MAKKDTPLLVSAAGWIGGFIDGLQKELRKRGVAEEEIHAFVRNGGEAPLGKIADVLAEAMKKVSKFKVWKTIRLGTGLKTADDFRKALKAGGYQIGDWTNDVLSKPAFSVATKEVKVELVKVSVGELGFQNGATRQQIYQKAQELGLKLCPNEVGPQLRLQYPDQPYGEWLRIAMEPITDSGDGLGLFGVGHGGHVQWLYGRCGGPGGFWRAGRQFVFCK